MPSMRRMRVFGVIVFSFVLYVLYITGRARESRDPDFYSRTKHALDLDKKSYHPHQVVPPSQMHKGDEDDDEALAKAMAKRLKDAESGSSDRSNRQAPKPEGAAEKKKPTVEDIGEQTSSDKTVAGRKKYPIKDGSDSQKLVEASAEDHDVEIELNSILKRSPIIIFSKSYCPHSAEAKNILLEKYSIIPEPYVVELDHHPMGALLQNRLAKMTGRRTVPNVLINGKSIGGGDDVAELDMKKTLIETVKTMGGKRMQEVIKRT